MHVCNDFADGDQTMRLLTRLSRDPAGTAAVELGLILAFLVIAIVGGVAGLGGGVASSYNSTAQKVADATNP